MSGFVSGKARVPPPLPRCGRILSAGVLALFALLAPRKASAQTFPDNHFAIDLFQGPILAPISVTAVGGAYAGYAEGIHGMVVNAAAPAVREPVSVSYLDLDISGSISIPIPIFENNDFDNSGSIDYDYSNFIYGTLGGTIQYGRFGTGFNAELQRYTLTDTQGETTGVTVGKYHVLAGARLFGDQLVLGGGVRAATLGIDAPEGTLTMAGVAPEIGLLIRPDWKSFRIGATYRFAVDGGPLIGGANVVEQQGVKRAGGLTLPEHVVLPWELQVGFALQIGPRPINPEWINPRDEEEAVYALFEKRRAERKAKHRAALARETDPAKRAVLDREELAREAKAEVQDFIELKKRLGALKPARRARYWNWPREHLLLTFDLLVTGPVANGVSIQAFLGQSQPGQSSDPKLPVVGTSGADVNFSPRFGIETEPVPDLVHTRLGTYYEPSRFGLPVGRQHFTFGADVKLFPTTWFGLVPEVIYKLQASADLSPRYQSFSLGLGVWH